MASFKNRNSRDTANRGVKMFIKGADDKPTEDWLLIRGQYSDEFQKAAASARAKVLDYMEQHGKALTPAHEAFAKTVHDEQVVALVADWSFEEECSPLNIREFFSCNPDVASEADKFAGNSGKFVAS